MTQSPTTARQVFQILVHEHADMLLAYLRSLVRSPHVVEDLFQETMLVAWRRLADYDSQRAFGPWLRGIATKLVLRQRERDARACRHCEPAVLEALEQRFGEHSASPESLGETLRHLLECLQELPERLRAAVGLAYREGLLLRVVAQRLDSSEEAIKKRLQRGRGLLANCIRARTRQSGEELVL